MSLPSYYKFWQPNTDLNFDTDIMSGYKKLNSMGLGLGSNKPSLPTKSGLGSVLGIAGGVAGGLMDLYQGLNADTSEIDNAVDRQIDALGNLKYNKADSIDELMANQSAYRGLEANHTADEFYKGPSDGEIFTNALAKGASSALSTSSAGPIASAISGGLGFLGSLAGGIFGRKAQRRAASAGASELNTEERRKNAYMDLAFRNDANNINTINNRTLMSQVGISAYGGPLGVSLTPVNGAIDFMQNEELLSSLGEDTTKNNNRRVSMPMFAFGGALGGYGGDWSNGLTYIGAGGSHEENPLGGVPAGMSQDGRPNQVEEGEYIWTDQDYVFSKRIEIPEEEYEALGLKKGKRKLTYADGAEILQKESAERPNDPISERGKNAALMSLMQSQEQQRALLAQQEQFNNMEDMAAYAADGGPIHIAKNKRGTFTAAAKKHSMGVQEFASKVLANKEDYSPAMVKKANFARNASKWHALGGHLFWPGGPKNPPYYGDIIYGRGLGAVDEGSLMDNMMIMGPQDYYIPNFYSNVLGANAGYREVADKPKSTIQTKPFAQSPIKQNPTPIYLPDDSEMNRYIAATNPLAIHDLTVSDNLGFKYSGLGTTYNTASTTNTTNTTNTNNKGQRDLLPTSGWQTSLRYLPAIAPAISLGYSLFKKPDYGYADELDAAGNAYAEAIREGGKVTPKFIGDYLAYNPFDRIFYANELGAQQAANRSAIMNAGNANRGATMAALLGSGYNDNVGLGKLFREGDEYNLAQRQKVADFNRGTNQYNSTLDMQAQEINAKANMAKAEALLNNKYRVLGMKQAIDSQRDQNISLALTNLFNNIGGIGEDFVNRYDRNALINADVFGTLSQKPYGVSDADWQDYVNAHKKVFSANGGKLNRKKKKGLTI